MRNTTGFEPAGAGVCRRETGKRDDDNCHPLDLLSRFRSSSPKGLRDYYFWNSAAKACVLVVVKNRRKKQQQLLKLRFQLNLRAAGPRPFFDPYFLLELWLCVEHAASPPQLPTASISCVNRLLGASSEVVVQGFLDFCGLLLPSLSC